MRRMIIKPLATHLDTRANPFPKVTDLFCRLPLPTLFYQLEALHLEDLLRLSVRPVAKAITSPGFSRTVTGAPDSTKMRCSTNRQALPPVKLLPGPLDC